MAILLLMCVIVHAKVFIVEPDEIKLKFPAGVTSSLANFGNPPYGSYIIGNVHRYDYYTNGCSPLEAIPHSMVDPYNHPMIILDRGNCSFVVKVRHAQAVGASAVIIVDNKPNESPEHVMMIDDGTAGNIYIPSVLISKKDGEILKDHFNKTDHSELKVKLTFEIPNPDNHVEYELWMSSEHSKLRNFLVEFAPHAKKLEKITTLSPHYVLWYSVERSRDGFKSEHPDCLSGGRYCAPDPDYEGPRKGREIVVEDLRQICIHKHNSLDLWWDYMTEFKACQGNDFTEKCANNTMKKVGINSGVVYKCMKDSVQGEKREIDDNSLLEAERKAQTSRGIFFYPALIINNQTFRGDLEVVEVMTALCAGFRDRPEYCKKYFEAIQEDDNPEVVIKGVGAGTILLIIFFSLVVFLAILYFYRKWLRRDIGLRMKQEVNAAVSQYIALTDQSLSKADS